MAGQYSQTEKELKDLRFMITRRGCPGKFWIQTIWTGSSSAVSRIFAIFVVLPEVTELSSSPEENSSFLTDSRYWTQAEEEVKGSQIVHYKKENGRDFLSFSPT